MSESRFWCEHGAGNTETDAWNTSPCNCPRINTKYKERFRVQYSAFPLYALRLVLCPYTLYPIPSFYPWSSNGVGVFFAAAEERPCAVLMNNPGFMDFFLKISRFFPIIRE